MASCHALAGVREWSDTMTTGRAPGIRRRARHSSQNYCQVDGSSGLWQPVREVSVESKAARPGECVAGESRPLSRSTRGVAAKCCEQAILGGLGSLICSEYSRDGMNDGRWILMCGCAGRRCCSWTLRILQNLFLHGRLTLNAGVDGKNGPPTGVTWFHGNN